MPSKNKNEAFDEIIKQLNHMVDNNMSLGSMRDGIEQIIIRIIEPQNRIQQAENDHYDELVGLVNRLSEHLSSVELDTAMIERFENSDLQYIKKGYKDIVANKNRQQENSLKKRTGKTLRTLKTTLKKTLGKTFISKKPSQERTVTPSMAIFDQELRESAAVKANQERTVTPSMANFDQEIRESAAVKANNESLKIDKRSGINIDKTRITFTTMFRPQPTDEARQRITAPAPVDFPQPTNEAQPIITAPAPENVQQGVMNELAGVLQSRNNRNANVAFGVENPNVQARSRSNTANSDRTSNNRSKTPSRK